MFQVTLHIRGALALGIVLGMNEASPTNAQTADITKGAQVLNGILAPTVGQKACFSRTYDGAHLRQHPRQQVMAMSFELRYVRTPSADIERYEFSMSVRTRARPNTLYTSGVCETNVDSTYPGGNLCTVDCDGGGVSNRESHGCRCALCAPGYALRWHKYGAVVRRGREGKPWGAPRAGRRRQTFSARQSCCDHMPGFGEDTTRTLARLKSTTWLLRILATERSNTPLVCSAEWGCNGTHKPSVAEIFRVPLTAHIS